jgi:hypothetical protein
MLAFDASSIIYAWDNYPLEQFPRLWEWMLKKIENEEFTIPEVVYGEVLRNSPECAEWLKEGEIRKLPITSDILAVCKLDEVDVRCINFVILIKESGEVF